MKFQCSDDDNTAARRFRNRQHKLLARRPELRQPICSLLSNQRDYEFQIVASYLLGQATAMNVDTPVKTRMKAVRPVVISVAMGIAILISLCSSTRATPVKRSTITRQRIVEAQQRLAELGYWIGEPEGKW